ncbi:hypothetical protein [Tenacibaculum aiptasiae]|uniref:hypothetical protein n=1 Tax=Tenacibaculum aiptasiae TaxID=426481 RepID=UPI00233130BF|nr:hypothetical protein [Tenacibaculum aiptasiae]
MKKLFILFIILTNIYKSYSCSCSHKKITQKKYDNYSLIFIGEIVEIEDCDTRGYQEFTFRIEQIFKGQTTKFVSGFNNCGGVCNYSYKLGQKWLVYSNPKHGLIKDQQACNQSIIIFNDENEWLNKNDYNIYKKELKFEVDFLQTRKTKDSKIVYFQFTTYIPFLKNIFILGVIILFFLLCFKLKIKLLPYSIGLGIISGSFYYLLLINFLFPKLMKPVIIHIILILSFLLISNIIYLTWVKDKFNFKKSFVYNYLSYISFIITTIYMIISTEHSQEIVYSNVFNKYFFFIIGIGIFFSLFSATFLYGIKNIRLKIKKGNM